VQRQDGPDETAQDQSAKNQPAEDHSTTADAVPRRGWRRPGKVVLSGIALLGVGAIAGGIASTAASASATTTTTTAAASAGTGSTGSSPSPSTVPGSGRQRPGAPPGGTLPLHGTITALGASSVTIKTSSGTTTYAVTASSDIEKGGKTTTLSTLAVGNDVAFSATTTDGTSTIGTLMTGNASSSMAAGCGPGRGPGGPRATSSPESPS
jgi:hypothetical protein